MSRKNTDHCVEIYHREAPSGLQHLLERPDQHTQEQHQVPPPFINGSFRCHVCPPEQRAGEEKNDVQEATVHVPVETKRLPVATIPTDAEDWISE
ncbi:hypothetical protein KOW79_008968 [Hemibagrus wyckioides]|uniref:Uncharacterized protein n=1 Tax=Hemibagrus wyckioides TaxID=337641 RepID=A0A9D3NUY4_9TELE|nr:hypothetical protein KOW79_008968 [Hemibagrus wyckioides]